MSRLTPQETRNNESNISNNRAGPRPQRGGSNIRGMGNRPGNDRPPTSRNNMPDENGMSAQILLVIYIYLVCILFLYFLVIFK